LRNRVLQRALRRLEPDEGKPSRPVLRGREKNNPFPATRQNVLKRIDRTFRDFYSRVKQGKAGFPRFKSQSRYDSFCFPQGGFSITENKLTLSKIGTIKLKLSRRIQGKIKTCTIKHEIDKWFVIFTVETKSEPLPKTGESIGIDVGISSFLTLSDGTKIENFKYYEQSQKKLRVAQRRVTRRKRGSNRRRSAVLQLQKIHRKIRNQRADFQHKIANYIVKSYDLIAIEKLSILGLSRGILSKQVNDVAWSSFFQKLKSKAECAARQVIEVTPNYTSQACSQCGNIVKKDLSVRIHYCLQCGLKICRDLNAAINIKKLAVGQTVKGIKWAVASCLPLVSSSKR
jgi:putative transposase